MEIELYELKQEVYQASLIHIEAALAQLQQAVQELEISSSSDTKSSAGDKYETSREMIQLEKNKLVERQRQTLKLQQALHQIKPENKANKIDQGTLVKTNLGYFFLGPPLGLLKVGQMQVFAMSTASPLGKMLQGKQVNEQLELNGRTYQIQDFI